ncbi:hypothetical protein GCM10020331_045500 [Ectobacillus funiculus]
MTGFVNIFTDLVSTKKTGIDLPGESGNTILFDKQIQKVTTAFGQGSTVTPIQQIQAATAIANNGKK